MSKSNSSAEGNKQPYQKYTTWADKPFWRSGNYSPKSIAELDKWLEGMRKDSVKRFKSIQTKN